MAPQNRKRNSHKKGHDNHSLWGFLFRSEKPANDMTHGTLFDAAAGMEEEETDFRGRAKGLIKDIWAKISLWQALAIVLFLAFIGILVSTTWRMWQAQDLSNVAGYKDNVPSKNLDMHIRTKIAAHEEVVITEAEINRYLRDTCRIRQDGIFSIAAQAQGIAIRVHDGYAELIIERIIGADFRQTTAVHLSFHQTEENGIPTLHVDYRGGDPMFGNTPRGGSIGSVGIPQRHIVVLQPALETLRDSYPGIRDAILNHGYCPYFEDGKIILRPFSQQQPSVN